MLLDLLRKSRFNIHLCFAWPGREVNPKLPMASFIVKREENGVKYLSLVHNPHTKIHKDLNDPQKETLQGFILAAPEDLHCPSDSF